MSVCILQNLEKYEILWTDFSASGQQINRFSVSRIGPEPAKPMISLALVYSKHLTLKNSERPKFYGILINLSAVGLKNNL